MPTETLPPELQLLLEAAGLETDPLPDWGDIEFALLQPMYRWRLAAQALGLHIQENPDLDHLRELQAFPKAVVHVLSQHFEPREETSGVRQLALQMVNAVATDYARLKQGIERQTATIVEARRLLRSALDYFGLKPDADAAPSKLLAEVIALVNMIKESRNPLGTADVGHALWLCGFQPGDDPKVVFERAAKRASEWQEIEALLRRRMDRLNARDSDRPPLTPLQAVKGLLEDLDLAKIEDAQAAEEKLAAIAALDPDLKIADPLDLARHMHEAMLRWESIARTLGICATKDPPTDIAGFIDNRAAGQLLQETMREAFRSIKPGSTARTEPDLDDVLKFLWQHRASEILAIHVAAARGRELRELAFWAGLDPHGSADPNLDMLRASTIIEAAKQRHTAQPATIVNNVYGDGCKVFMPDGTEVPREEPSRDQAQATEAIRTVEKIAETLGWEGDLDKQPEILARVRDLAAFACSVASLHAGLMNPQAAEVTVDIAAIDLERVTGQHIHVMRDLLAKSRQALGGIDELVGLLRRFVLRCAVGLGLDSDEVRYMDADKLRELAQQVLAEDLDGPSVAPGKRGPPRILEALRRLVMRFSAHTADEVDRMSATEVVSVAEDIVSFKYEEDADPELVTLLQSFVRRYSKLFAKDVNAMTRQRLCQAARALLAKSPEHPQGWVPTRKEYEFLIVRLSRGAFSLESLSVQSDERIVEMAQRLVAAERAAGEPS